VLVTAYIGYVYCFKYKSIGVNMIEIRRRNYYKTLYINFEVAARVSLGPKSL